MTVSKKEIEIAKGILRERLKAQGIKVLKIRVKKYNVSFYVYLQKPTATGLTMIICNWPRTKVIFPKKTCKPRRRKRF